MGRGRAGSVLLGPRPWEAGLCRPVCLAEGWCGVRRSGAWTGTVSDAGEVPVAREEGEDHRVWVSGVLVGGGGAGVHVEVM